MMILALWIALFPLSPALAEGPRLSLPCAPLIKKAKEEIACEIQLKCGMESCSAMSLADQQAAESAVRTYNSACAKAKTLEQEVGTACAANAEQCLTRFASKIAEIKKELEDGAKTLEARAENIDKLWRPELGRELGAMKANKPTDPYPLYCHPKRGTQDPEMILPSMRDRLIELLTSGRSTETNVGLPEGSFLNEMVKDILRVNKSSRETKLEARHMRELAVSYGKIERTSLGRGRNLNTSKDPSTITGDQDKNKGDMAKGSPQSGGGSGGGDKGGGQGGQPQSGITDAKHPGGSGMTGELGGSEKRQASDDKRKDDDKNKGLGPVDVSKARDISSNPSQLAISAGGGSISPSRLSDESPGKDRRNSATAASSGGVGGGGGGGAGGGLASPGARGDGGHAASETGSGASSAGGGNFGGGSFGGSSSFGGGEELSQFGKKDLGDPKMALAGSETDASVKNIVDEFKSGPGREPAGDFTEGIGDRNSMDLFDRMHQFWGNCQPKNCISGSRGRKMEEL